MSQFGIVSIFYQPGHVRRTLQALTDIKAADNPPGVCVANQPAAEAALQNEPGRPASFEVLRHDNSGMEFGAYQAGLDRLLERFDPEWVLFVNDTLENTANFSNPYRRSLRRWLGSTLSTPSITGMTQSIARSYVLDGVRTHRWIRTHVFALNRAALSALEYRIHRPALDSLVNVTTSVEDFFSDDLDPVLRDHLEVWLFRTRPGPHWHQTVSLEDGQAPRVAAKARSILQEKYLASRLDGVSSSFLDLHDLPMVSQVLRKLDDLVFEWRRGVR